VEDIGTKATSLSSTSVLEVMHALAGLRERYELMETLAPALHRVLTADWVVITIRRGREGTEADGIYLPEFEGETSGVTPFIVLPVAFDAGRAHRVTPADIASSPYHFEIWRRNDVKAALRIPLIVENAFVGAVAFWSRTAGAFDEVDLQIATELGMVVAVVFDSCLAYEQLAQLRDEARDNNAYLREALAREVHSGDGMVGHGPAFSAVKRQIEVVAPTDATVLLTGESGTGKDVAARAIHDASARRDRPMVTVNCAAIPQHLAETELFGHEEGAFTGALKSRAGRFEQANGGTLFLDEVGELPLELQAKLLRVIQERELERVGGSEAIKVDVRIIAATNRDLQELIAADRFREDLFFRLAVFPIHLPPLRSRLEDLPELVDHFVTLASARFQITPRQVTPEVIRRLADHDWPGNVRELQHAIERALIVSPSDSLSIDAIVPRRIAPISTGIESTRLRDEYMRTLAGTGWVIEGADGAAARLGVHPNTLRHRLKRLGIARPATR
jgi:formate hydrogenlyase transcriptional activator